MAEIIQYFITNKCKNCAQCQDVCPEKAIYAAEDKYCINDARCNGCGSCVEICPEQAIVKETDPFRSINREADSFFGSGVWPLGDYPLGGKEE
ncbi:4Fe-4S ferredoxin iron-sulfur binding domain-containing protein [Desulfotomaculum nigrificans CO-1-SRB]|uniref:4Fe-4S ferredoxin iron-sulfur binding domain-containing protein n=1 Tax=Desulfotomaculum nigrificans (strain DSM 14880 / VKM B-2319 / CO-1-SRB) TaxID=868595 RepID=F6B5B5_DESCC|nr:4Fe-4S binding protein [Desulfotomaculum nigrificans]AEF94236.1 4Fe-4S ferredoxin iron-sulfur binding domain-containing protein [Desulfotomaculum nigrificans CO-1-SRB]